MKKSILMYVENNVFNNTPIHLRVLIYLAQNRELSGEIKMKIQIIEKAKKWIATKL